MRFVIPLLLVACAENSIPIVNCSSDFRDTWWLASETYEGDHYCFHFSSSKTLVIFELEDNVYEWEWECVGDDRYQIVGQGYMNAKKIDEDSWFIDVTYHGLIHKESKVTNECEAADNYCWPWTDTPWCSDDWE